MVTVVIVDCSLELKMKTVRGDMNVFGHFLGVCVPRTQRVIRRKALPAVNKDQKIKM